MALGPNSSWIKFKSFDKKICYSFIFINISKFGHDKVFWWPFHIK